MTQWEYLFLRIWGHNKNLDEAQNMIVTTSDGRWQDQKLPTDVFGLVRQLGEEGWEMVNCGGGNVSSVEPRAFWPRSEFEAVFKRPR